VTADDRPFGMAEALADPNAMAPSAAVAARAYLKFFMDKSSSRTMTTKH
jgi:hypothetical protein